MNRSGQTYRVWRRLANTSGRAGDAHCARPPAIGKFIHPLVNHLLHISMPPFRTRTAPVPTLIVALLFVTATAFAQDRPKPEETEVWEPVPPIVNPGPFAGSPAPPSDAIVLFGGDNLDEWVSARDGSPAGWVVNDGVFNVVQAAGSIQTRRTFRDYQLHLEWRVPEGVQGSGQARGNSGLFMAWDTDRRQGYEIQILDSYENSTYVNGMAGATYKQSIPLVNPIRPPGEWQSYDVTWTAPRFAEDGSLISPARVTAFFNGILIQNDVEMEGETYYIGAPEYHPFDEAPIYLQAHGDPGPTLSFRNIWIRPLE